MLPNGTAISNDCHNLVVYKVDKRKLKQAGLRAAQYLTLPSLVADLATTPKPSAVGLSLASNDWFTIEINLCCMLLTQDVRVLKLINWAADKSIMATTLTALCAVNDDEIVKQLPQILDALFEMLCFTSIAALEKLVLKCILKVIEIVNIERFELFQCAVLDEYVKDRFSSALVYKKLIRVMQKQIVDYSTTLNDRDLYRLLRNTQYIFKIISRSRQLYTKQVMRDELEFEDSIQELLSLFVSLTSSLKMCRSHGAIVKFVHVISDEWLTVYSPAKLWYVYGLLCIVHKLDYLMKVMILLEF